MPEAVHWLVTILILVVVAVSGWPVTLAVLELSSRIDGKKKSKTSRATKSPETQLRGGLWIGFVERFGTAAAIMSGQPALIAVIVAVKGLGRFKELSTPEASERFVLGTLVSLTWAALGGMLGLALLRSIGV